MSDIVAHIPHQRDESSEIPILKAGHVRGPLPRGAGVIVARCAVRLPVEIGRGAAVPVLPGILLMLKEMSKVFGHGINYLKERLAAIEEKQDRMEAALAEVRGLTLLQGGQQEWYRGHFCGCIR